MGCVSWELLTPSRAQAPLLPALLLLSPSQLAGHSPGKAAAAQKTLLPSAFLTARLVQVLSQVL